MPEKGRNPLTSVARRQQVKVRTRQTKETAPGFASGISNGAYNTSSSAGNTRLSVPHNSAGVTIGQPVQVTRSNIPMFDFVGATVVPTTTTQSLQQVAETAITETYPAKALQYVDGGGGV